MNIRELETYDTSTKTNKELKSDSEIPGVASILFKPTNTYYIFYSTDLKKAYFNQEQKLSRNKHPNLKFQADYNQYGYYQKKNKRNLLFSVLEVTIHPEQQKTYWITEFISKNLALYNNESITPTS